jgi:hypothetical protein
MPQAMIDQFFHSSPIFLWQEYSDGPGKLHPNKKGFLRHRSAKNKPAMIPHEGSWNKGKKDY